jgi:protein-tyrosine-phosphatase
MKLIFVCLGNICRSPLAEGIFRNLAGKEGLGSEIIVDSAGTGHRSMAYRAISGQKDVPDCSALWYKTGTFRETIH